MTLEGTRTFLIGEERVAIIDPGPLDDAHIDALVAATAGAAAAGILLTHSHPDHAGAADALAARLGAPVLGLARGTLAEGDAVATDAGAVLALHTPGHTADHLSFHWPDGGAVFCGDLMMGGMDTALVAPPEGSLADYLASLGRLRALDADVIHPAHGPSFEEPAAAIDACVRHRADRQEQVLAALRTRPLTERELTDAVYGGTVPPGLEEAAAAAVRAYLDHLHAAGRVALRAGRWRRA